MPELTLKSVLDACVRGVQEALPRQLMRPEHPDYGGIISPSWGVATPGADAAPPFISLCALLYVASSRGLYEVPLDLADLVRRGTLATAYMTRRQRPSGRIDLMGRNYDDGTTCAFALHPLCAALELGRPLRGHDRAWDTFLEALERFVYKAAVGMLDGGFNTPNHRWIVAAALAQAGALFPDLEAKPVLEAYLAEGIDVDDEGVYTERSVGVYDGFCDRSLYLLAERGYPEVRAAAHANLAFNLHLLHPDGTAETALSHRQDGGTRPVPLTLAEAYLLGALIEKNPAFLGAAEHLWRAFGTKPASPLLGYALLRYGEPDVAPAPPPDHGLRFFPQNGLVRFRRGDLSATFVRGSPRLMTFLYGAAELSALRVEQAYFGSGRFMGENLTLEGDTLTFRSEGNRWHPHRPGYEHPLGRPVPRGEFYALTEARDWRPLPRPTSTLTFKLDGDGFSCHLKTHAGLDRVPAQLAFDFPEGGVWETEDAALKPLAGQVLFLKRGFGTMRYGDDVIRVGPSAHAHRAWHLRDTEPAPRHVRVLITFLTPMDYHFVVRASRGWD